MDSEMLEFLSCETKDILDVQDNQDVQASSLSLVSGIPKQKKDRVGIGTKVQVKKIENDRITSYFIAGDWTSQAGHKIDDSIIMSRKSPLAKELWGKKVGDEIFFKVKLVITNIEN